MIKMMIKTQKSEYQEIEDLEVANDTRFEITDDIRAFIKHTDKVPIDIEDLSTDYIMINAYREINRKIVHLVSFIDRAKNDDILSLIDKRIKRITLFSNDDFILFARWLKMGSLTYLFIISVVSYLIYYTYKVVTRPLSSSLRDDIKKIKDKIKKDK